MWDERYSEEGYVYGTTPNTFLKSICDNIPKGGRVLCLAEGEGRNAVYLAKQGFQVTAVDQSSVGLQKAQQLAHDNGVEISTIVANLADYELGNELWDGIVSIFAHLPPAIRKQLHAKVLKALKVNGVFILEAYTKEQLHMSGVGGPSNDELLMSLDDLNIELKGLEFEIAQELKRPVNEGKYHQGESAVVQVVASKKS